MLVTSLIWATLAHASPDPRLLSLVPPGAQLFAGISASSFRGQPSNFLLITERNRLDLEDFFALTGGDDTRSIHQAIFIATFDDAGMLKEHSLLVSGHFAQARILKSAVDRRAVLRSYRSIPILQIEPLTRERDKINDVRWLAILDSSLLLFGSVAISQIELDRYLSHSHPEEVLLRRLSHLRGKDQTWCVLAGSIRSLSSPSRMEEIRWALAAINPDLADMAMSSEELEFGLFYGREVELEYSLSRALIEQDKSHIESAKQFRRESVWPAALLSTVKTTEHANTVHETIAIPVPRFEEWLANLSTPR